MDSCDNTPQSTEVQDKVYGNLLQDITLESSTFLSSSSIRENQHLIDDAGDEPKIGWAGRSNVVLWSR